jgi:hypothetical protein
MKYIIPTLSLITLAAASANAQTAASKPKFSYDRLSVAFSSSDANVDTVTFAASAELTKGLIISGAVGDTSSDVLDAKSVGAGLGIAQDVGSSGSLLFSASYIQITDIDTVAADGVSFGLAYRHLINPSIEIGVQVLQQEVDSTVGSSDDTLFGLGVRFNVNQSFFINASFNFAEDDFWTLGAGYEF